MAHLITQVDIKNINDKYLELKTYAAVSRALGFSPSTIKKYVIEGYTKVDEGKIKRYEKNLPDFDDTCFYGDDWNNLCCIMSDEEMAAIEELWEEMEV